MARMYPERILDSDTPPSERKVFDALAKLDDEWLVMHSVAWQGMRRGRQSDGEVDFVIAHPRKGVLVLEVKGGGITIENGQWLTTNRRGESFRINPFGQIRDSKHFLGEYLAEQIPRIGDKVHMGHAVLFPDVEISTHLSPEAKREVILDRSDLVDISASIGRLSAHWRDLTTFDEQQFASLRKGLAPDRSIRRLLRYEVEDRIEELIELTDQQLQVLSILRRQRRAMITGGAGTGKTVLATERARQLGEDGHRVLLLSYNALLGQKLADEMDTEENVTATSFHKFARGQVNDAGMLPDVLSDSFWAEDLPNLLPAAAEMLGTVFDAIVIDEGQDFYPAWWTALQLLMSDPDDGFLYVFADAQQDVYRTGWEPPFDDEPYVLDINCRNTIPVAERVGAVFGHDERSRGIDGPKPKFIELTSPRQAPKQVAGVLARLLGDSGMRADQIAVLCSRKALVDGLRGQKIDGTTLASADGHGITVETIHRFKGLESDAVVLVLVLDEMSDDDRALAYVGMSRARVLLEVLGSSEVKESLNWT